MNNFYIARFYFLLPLLYFSDMILLLSNIWNSLKVTSSPIFLGLTLSVGTLLLFALGKLKFFKIKKFITLKDLYTRRIVIYTLLLIVALAGKAPTKFGFITTSLSIGYLSLITLSTLEATNTKLVLDGHISSNHAARIMQTLIQIGSFFGALCSGFLLIRINYNNLIIILCIFDIIVSLCAHLLFREPAYNNLNLATNSKSELIKPNSLSRQLKYLSFIIGIVGLHICAFNTLTPVLFQNIKHLGADYFGICSGVAGIGAFTAAWINIKKFHLLLPAVLLTFADMIFTLTSWSLLAAAICFFIGFSINTIRIHIRKNIIDATQNNDQANIVAQYGATIYTLTQSISPLILGILISQSFLGNSASLYLFPAIGGIMLLFVLFIPTEKGV